VISGDKRGYREKRPGWFLCEPNQSTTKQYRCPHLSLLSGTTQISGVLSSRFFRVDCVSIFYMPKDVVSIKSRLDVPWILEFPNSVLPGLLAASRSPQCPQTAQLVQMEQRAKTEENIFCKNGEWPFYGRSASCCVVQRVLQANLKQYHVGSPPQMPWDSCGDGENERCLFQCTPRAERSLQNMIRYGIPPVFRASPEPTTTRKPWRSEYRGQRSTI